MTTTTTKHRNTASISQGLLSLLVLGQVASPAVAVTSSLVEKLEGTHPMWLRERCMEAFYADPATRQPLHNFHEVEKDIAVSKVEVDDAASVVTVTFSDDSACRYPTAVLEADLANDVTFLQVQEWGFPEVFTWDAATLLAPPLHQYSEVIAEDNSSKAMFKFLSDLLSVGLVVVENIPSGPGYCVPFAERFTTLRDTEWGKVFNVQSKPDADNAGKLDLSYSDKKIGMHLDNVYRHDGPPGYQLLHAINHCRGEGCFVHNRFTDGFKVAAAIWETDRALFDILTRTVVRWENNAGDNGSLLYRYSTVIELDERYQGNPLTDTSCPPVKAINFSAKSGGYAPHMSSEDLELFYTAKRLMSEMVHSEEYALKVQSYSGAMIVFDNRRILHARSHIEPTDGERWLQGCYATHDGAAILYERLRRKYFGTASRLDKSETHLTETDFRTLAQATKADHDRMGVEYHAAITEKTKGNLMNLLLGQSESYLGAGLSLYEHNLQTASRAARAGESDEVVFMSLFHDVFETLAVKNHGELITALLAPWLSPQSQWLLAHHEIFQGFYYFHHYDVDVNLRDMFLDHPFYNVTALWCEKYDQVSFDPAYPSLPLQYFDPIVDRVLARPQYWWNPDHPKAGAVSAAATLDELSENTTEIAEGLDLSACTDTWNCYSMADVESVSL